MKETLAINARGVYQVDVGPKGQAHRFYIGKDKLEAMNRKAKLLQLWDIIRNEPPEVIPVGGSFAPAGVWNKRGLEMGKAISAGKPIVIETVDPETTLLTMEHCSKLYPMVSFITSQDVQQAAEEYAAKLKGQADFVSNGFRSSMRFHKALERFKEHLRSTVVNAPRAQKLVNDATMIADHIDDFDMADLTLAKIDDILSYFAKRPKSKRKKDGRVLAVATIRDLIKLVRRFLKWAFRYGIATRPAHYEVIPVILDRSTKERVKTGKVKRFEDDQLPALYMATQTPFERVCVLLALNTGAGLGELSHLTIVDKSVELEPGLAHLTGNKLRMIRHKNYVFGAWELWPETLEAIEQWKAVRPASEAANLLVDKKGQPLTTRTACGAPNTALAMMWRNIKKRFPTTLSFNKIRKTHATLVRKKKGGEAMRLSLCHGQPVKSDELAEVYSSKCWRRVFRACRLVREHLAPMFATVATIS